MIQSAIPTLALRGLATCIGEVGLLDRGQSLALYKALADESRIQILMILSRGPRNGQALAAELEMTPPTITHHMARLRKAGLVRERRERNMVYFELDGDMLYRQTLAAADLICGKAKRVPTDADALASLLPVTSPQPSGDALAAGSDATRLAPLIVKTWETKPGDDESKAEKRLREVLSACFDAEGRLCKLPNKRKKRALAIDHLLVSLPTGRVLSETAVMACLARTTLTAEDLLQEALGLGVLTASRKGYVRTHSSAHPPADG
jgi:DNA-binding transcriptional ArsR family regulator